MNAESPTFSEQYQQSLFDMLKGRPKYYVVTLIDNYYPNFYNHYNTAVRLQSRSTVDTAVQADYLAVAPGYLTLVENRMHRIIIQIFVQISCAGL